MNCGGNEDLEYRASAVGDVNANYVTALPPMSRWYGQISAPADIISRDGAKEQMVCNNQMNSEDFSGYIFMCNGRTKPECYMYRVFGLPAGRREVIEKIKPGMKLFLFDYEVKYLYGVYEATTAGKLNWDTAAFGGNFPAQLFCSSMFSTERHYFVSRATQRELPSDVVLPDTEIQRGEEIILMVPIRLRFFKLIGRRSHRWIGAPRDVTYDGEPILINEVGINFNLSLIKSRRHKFRDYMARKLTSLGVPKYEQPAIHQKIVQAVQVALPHLPISVIMVDVTVHLFGEAVTPITGIMADLLASVSSSQVTIDTDTWESMETYIHEPTSIPATKTSIEGLENLRLDDLEEDTIIQASPCVICLEQLDHFDTDLLMVVTRLPCSHLYHRACIIGWLQKSHLCPLCQYPMPSVEPEARKKPTKPSWTQHWPMLLMLSAGGVITATLVCRLWKRSEG